MIGLQGQRSRIMDGDEVLTVVRDTKGVVDGKFVVVSSETFTVRANVQPVEGRDLLLVPEGDRFKENVWLFTQDAPLRQNDRVVRGGVNFEVQNNSGWGGHQEVRACRIDVGVNATP